MTRMMMRRRGNSDSVMYISPNSSSVSKVISRSCFDVRRCFSFLSFRKLSILPPELTIESMSARNCESSSEGVSIDCCRIAFR